jgi:protein disulfide-isomerase A1
VKRALRPSIQDITEQQQLDNFLTSDDYVFLAQLHGDDKSLVARFRNLAEEYSDRYSFGIASSPDASSSGIWCYNNVDESEHTATDLDDANALKKLVDLCTAEVIPQLTRRNELTHLSVGFYV